MSDTKIADLTSKSSLGGGDLFVIVDVSDTTDSLQGSSKKVAASLLVNPTYIIQTASTSLPNAQVLASLSTGIMIVTTTTGVISSISQPSGTIVGTSDTQTLTNKDLSSATNTLPTSVVTLTGSQVLTNKTLTTPIISSISNTGTITLPTSTDTLVGKATTDTLTNKTLTSPLFQGTWDGWIGANETWTYASASTFTISGDQTTKYQVGTKIKFTQTTVKYAVITAISYSAPTTTVTIAVNTDYTIANAAISANYYSFMENPIGWPDWFNFTISWSGYSSAPTTTTAKYKLSGRKGEVIYKVNALGTSNSTSNSCTGFPVTPNTNNTRETYGIYSDNGSTGAGFMGTYNSTGIVFSNNASSDTAWTNTGTKGIYSFHCHFDW